MASPFGIDAFGPGPARADRGDNGNDPREIAQVETWQRGAGGIVYPRYESPVTQEEIEAGDGERVLEFSHSYGRIHKDSIGGKTGDLIPWLPWQVRLIERIYARDPQTGRRLARRYLVGVARKNGKSALAAVLALYALLMEGAGAEVYSCAADREQARLVFLAARRMVEMDPELSGLLNVGRDWIEDRETGSTYRALSSEAFTKEGLSPSFTVYDELHAAPDRELYDVMSLAMGARVDPLMVVVTTAGVMVDRNGVPTIAKQLYEYGKRVAGAEVKDKTFGFSWYEPANPSADPGDHEARLQANPSLGVVLDPADLDSAMPPQTPENEYRTKRLNLWVTGAKSWLPWGEWEACAATDKVVVKAQAEERSEDGKEVTKPAVKGDEVILAFDGSWTNDSTALIGVRIEDKHIFVVDAWERPPDRLAWVVPTHEVEAALFQALADYEVAELAADPYYWREHLERWSYERGAPVVEWPTNVLSRIVPATREFYTAVVERRLTHDGDPRLERHIANATIKEDMRGARIVKQAQGMKIDLAVSAVMGINRALTYDEGTAVSFIAV